VYFQTNFQDFCDALEVFPETDMLLSNCCRKMLPDDEDLGLLHIDSPTYLVTGQHSMKNRIEWRGLKESVADIPASLNLRMTEILIWAGILWLTLQNCGRLEYRSNWMALSATKDAYKTRASCIGPFLQFGIATLH
jgi:hypothetical protein